MRHHSRLLLHCKGAISMFGNGKIQVTKKRMSTCQLHIYEGARNKSPTHEYNRSLCGQKGSDSSERQMRRQTVMHHNRLGVENVARRKRKGRFHQIDCLPRRATRHRTSNRVFKAARKIYFSSLHLVQEGHQLPYLFPIPHGNRPPPQRLASTKLMT